MVAKIEEKDGKIGIEGNQFSQEEAKEFMEHHFGKCQGLTQTIQEIGDVLSQWEADELKTKGVFVLIPQEEVLKDFQALRQLGNTKAKEISELSERLNDTKLKYMWFKNIQTGAVYSFPDGATCAFVGYKLSYFKK